MIRNYFRIAIRALWKHRGSTAINGIGLAVSLAVALLVLLFMRQQWRMDRFHSESEKIHMRYGPLGDLASAVGGVAILAILIALLGLLSLAAYHVQTRTKEIGIRKAHGAGVFDVVTRLSGRFALLVAGAAVVAAPVAWILNRGWLRLMADPVGVRAGVVLVYVLGLVGIALVTIATQTLRAARIDPARTLQDE